MENKRMETRQERIAKLKRMRAYQRNSKWIGATFAVSLTAVSMFGQPEEAKACDCATSYTVKKGDTIYSLAEKYQVSVEQLKSKNGFTSDTLYVGQQITVPTLDENNQPLHLQGVEEESDNSENTIINKEPEQKVEQSAKLKEKETPSTPPQVTMANPTEKVDTRSTTEKIEKPIQQTMPQQAGKNGSVIHTVQSGDSLWKIANKYGTTIEQIRKDNNLKSDALTIGQKLIINQKGAPTKPGSGQKPVETPKPKPPANSASTVTHIVQSGDSLWKIANKYGTTIEQIRKDNNLKSDALTIGQKLIINQKGTPAKPGSGQKPVEKPKPKPPANSASTVTHIVQSGDSLWKIANKYGTTIEQIRKDNNLKSDALTIGQKLIINQKGTPAKPGSGQKPVEKPKPKPPANSASTVTHIVQSGDSLWKIANKYGTTIEQIRKDNNLKSDALTIGQKLIINKKGTPTKPGSGQKPVEKPKPKPPANSASTITHIVQSGDSLWKIANKYGTTIEQIRKDNNLKSDALTIGQKLIINKKGTPTKPGSGQKPVEKPKPKPPANNASTVTYIVQSGDSLWKIANKYGTTIEQIRKDNNLKSDALTIGQKLIITPKGKATKTNSGQKLVIHTDKQQTNKKEPGKIPGQQINKKPKEASSNTIIVKNGDSLSLLAKKYNISVEKLMKDNQLTSTTLQAGQKIVIDHDQVTSAKQPSVTYQVKAGDTLYSLADRFNTEVNQLMELNQLQYPIAVIGTNLQIPADHVKRSQGMIVGAIDNTSIEVLIDDKHQALEVSYGSSHNYQSKEGQQVLLTYTKGSADQRPALINVAKI
ncbi:LysM peptidoglycan-binding domain-containing protein [Bacillus sp. FJAT-52991]|uniref:LysM peptidoglycan-binding domain-containing protein n=1 Tax=Bacillus kandeliae TaxID=3129297 RepID=A0ABZ2N7K3_9BACI